MLGRQFSLHSKILLLCLLLTAIVVVSSVIVFINYDRNQFQHIQLITANVVKNASAIAKAISNKDKTEAQNNLDQLLLNPDIASVDAYILNNNGVEQYLTHPENSKSQENETYFSKQLEFMFPIYERNNIHGGVYVKSINVSHSIFTFLELIALLILITFFIAMYIEDTLMQPFTLLVNAIREITTKNNYSFRLDNTSSDEVGSLIAAFNAMLDKIQSDEKMDRQSKEQIKHLSYYDMLTNLPNVDLFNELIARQLQESKLNSHLVWLLLIKVDDYKAMNESYGQAQANEMLKLVAMRLSEFLAKDPTINSQYLIARYSTDQFIISLRGIELSEVNTIIQTLQKHIATTCKFMHATKIALSMGIAGFPKDGENYQDLLQKSTLALNQANAQGKGMHAFYEAGLHQIHTKKIELEYDLHDALANKQLMLVYQPKYRFDSKKIVGFEALLRWQHPKLGLIAPDDFITTAEQTGLIIPIGHWVIEQATEQCTLLHKHGHKDVHVAVNLSPKQFDDKSLVDHIKKTLTRTGLPAKYFQLELTESIILLNDEKTIELLQTLKEIGIKLAIDDFGTGYSSLRYLTQYPLDSIKIDKCFIKYVTQNKNDATITKAIIGLAKDLNLNVIAEGIENHEQYHYLKSEGCSEIQGYFISQPLSPQEIIGFLAQGNFYERNL